MDGIGHVHGGDARGGGLRVVQATEEEQAAIRAMLSKRAESAPAGAGVGRASALAWAGLKLAAIVLLAAGVGVGLGDGDEFDDVGCSVAQQPGGTSHGARSAQAREGAGGKVPGSDGGSAGPSGTGGAAGRPECEAQASGAQSSDPAGGQEVAAGAGSGAVPRPKGQGTEGKINAHNGSQGDSATEHREVMDALREIRDALGAVRRSAGQEEPINRKEAQRIFAVLAKLRTETGARKAPLHTVFEYLVLQGLSGERTARKCRCAPSLISARVKTLQERFGLSVRQLQNYASALVEMETTVKGDRRHRRASGPPDDFDRPGGPQDDADRQEGGEEDHFRDGEG
jgi:hypothetical protein